MELKSSEKLAIRYHDIFNYPLTAEELLKWSSSKILRPKKYYYLNRRKEIVKIRLQNEKYSKGKILIAKNSAKLISKIPTVKFVGITGALAMNNAGSSGDVDLMVITKKGCLWTTRFLVYLLIKIFGLKTRTPKTKQEKDKLCLNMWLDENYLEWNNKDRNIYTAHEVLQIVPLFNRDNTYEKFIYKNKWAIKYWPNAIKMESNISIKNKDKSNMVMQTIENILFKLQYLYMKSKITREVVTPTIAIFHPTNWGKVVMSKLKMLDR